jgi:hypothetical protein
MKTVLQVFLQKHSNVTVILDEEACSLLEKIIRRHISFIN